jgi:hypothetical protein
VPQLLQAARHPFALRSATTLGGGQPLHPIYRLGCSRLSRGHFVASVTGSLTLTMS